MKTRILATLLATLVAAAAIGGCSSSQPSKGTEGSSGSAEKKEAWEPKKEIEYIVAASPGGGSDINARTVADIVQKRNLSPKAFMVVNKPGGSTAVGFNYLGTKKGDSYSLFALHSGNIMASYVADWAKKWDDLSDIIAVTAYDDLTLCVNSDSKYKDIKSIIEAAKAAPGTLRFGSTQRGNSDHLAFEMFKKYTGTDFNYVQFDGSGDVATALLGKNVDVAIFNPAECIGNVQAGNFIPIATFAKERLPKEFANAPTFIEMGYPDIVLREYRGILCSKDMPKEAKEFYLDVAKKMVETDEWKKGYLEKNYLTPTFMGTDEAYEFCKKDIENALDMFKQTGYLK